MKNERDVELRKEAQAADSQADTGNLVEASKWVYKRYGTDLSAFFRDAYEAEEKRKHQERKAGNSDHVEVCPS